MIFATVGTTHGFDRLIRAIDEVVARGLLREPVLAQVGNGGYTPRNCEYVGVLDRGQFVECVKRSSSVISHAGMGILTLGLELEKPMLVMPRRRRYGEVVNDHQVEIARRYAAEGHVLVAWEYVDMFSQVVRLANFLPVPREPCVEAVIGRVSRFLETLAG